MVFAHTNRFRAEDPQYFRPAGAGDSSPAIPRPQKSRLEVRTRLSPGGRRIRTLGPAVNGGADGGARGLASPIAKIIGPFRTRPPRRQLTFIFMRCLLRAGLVDVAGRPDTRNGGR